ncbi:HNH endonuclease signature motif containing protein [Comamonas thiooxydans]|uniref:HNH endonuclease signature motif containing protein n=1 Tax=Comamonas thiooxydans TaxID=363952 RepID=UPI00209C5847|nr:HNH endonuclease signature motif containing protein [Comamonas thiooxydans]MCO8251123.1 HNH endonuclease [Comamonas thiooxydans]
MPKLQTLRSNVPMLGSSVPNMQAGSWRTSGQTAAQRGYGYKWQQARAQYLLEHPLCVMCEAATVVDHITPHRGDQSLCWRGSNWQPLRATHHSRDKQHTEQRM